MVLEGSHAASKQWRSLAKPRRRFWCLSHLGSENNLHPADRRTRSGVSAKRDDGRWHSDANADVVSYRYSDSNSKCYRESNWNLDCDSKCDGKSYCNADSNSKQYAYCDAYAEWDASCLRSRTGILEEPSQPMAGN